MAMPKKDDSTIDLVDFVAEAEKEAAAESGSVLEQATDGGRNPHYEGLFDGETEQHRAERLATASNSADIGVEESPEQAEIDAETSSADEENYEVNNQLTNPAQTGLAQHSSVNPTDFLAEQGFTDLKIDFTSFPIVKLEDERFQTADNDRFATEFQCQIIQERKSFMFIGDLGRDKDPEIVYSDDGIHQSGDDQKPMVGVFADWKARGIPYSRKEYKQVMVKVLSGGDGSLDEEIVMLQVPPKSIGKVDGYKIALSMRTPPVKVREAVTKVSVLPKVGTGLKAFNPWGFKYMGKIS